MVAPAESGEDIQSNGVVERRIWSRVEDDLQGDLEFLQREFRAGFEAVNRIDRPAVTIFGSARTPRTSRWYQKAREVAEGFAHEGFAVVTGGGPGIMEAANHGAQSAGGLSVGFGIVLPHEQEMNAYVDVSYEFKHFYARKVCFVKASEGFIAFPGGFGTNDELFEAMTLIQTGTINHFPVVLFGSEHWQPMVDWIHEVVYEEGNISPEDLSLFVLVDDPEAAVRAVVDCFRRDCIHPT